MKAKFVNLASEEQLDLILDTTHQKPIALFKHSNNCGISADIRYQLASVNGDIHVVVIQENRPLSNIIAERTGHRHQSPQAFVIKDGKPIYHATHYAIDPVKISELLNS